MMPRANNQGGKPSTQIPHELMDARQWVVWRYETRDGQEKPTKVPYLPRASVTKKASSTDPQTWGTYGAAITVAALNEFHGVGFLLTEGDPYIGIDLDQCINVETGQVDEWALRIVQTINSYTEITPSGRGLHILCKGKLPEDAAGNRRGPIEMYAHKRYLTVTGFHLADTPLTILDRSAEVIAVHEQYFARKPIANEEVAQSIRTPAREIPDDDILLILSRASNRSRFSQLWEGNRKAYPSESEADQALCSILSFYTQDPAQIDRLFRRSGLCRRKWLDRADYRDRTIQKALTGLSATYNWGERKKREQYLTKGPALVGLASYLKSKTGRLEVSPLNGPDEVPPAFMKGMHNGTGAGPVPMQSDSAPSSTHIPGLFRLSDVEPEFVQWLWPGRIPLGKLSIIDGDPSLGKSMITCDLAARVSKGDAMPDGSFGDLEGPAGVVIWSAEDGLSDTIRPRLDAAGADTTRIGAQQYVLDAEGERMPSLNDLTQLEWSISEYGAKLVIIDPLMAFLPGDINSYRDQDVRRVLAPLSKLAESTGAAIVVVRHLSKAGGAGNPLYRGGGSIGIIGAARSALLVALDPDDDSKARRIVAVTKGNLAGPVPSMAYRIEITGTGAPRVFWEGLSEHTAHRLLEQSDTLIGGSALAEAKEFLLGLLEDGSLPSADVLKEARSAGIADKTLRRAKEALGIDVGRKGFGKDGAWRWRLPEAQDNTGAEVREIGTGDTGGHNRVA